ncbi:hypothetical protein ACWPM1_06100 [Tsuneonella sp. HG249]
MRFRGTIVAFTMLAVAACTAQAPKPTPKPPVGRPTPAPTPTPSLPPPSANWMDAAQTSGDWYYRTGGGTTRALFGEAGADARFAITCDPAQRSITLARAGTAAGATQMNIRTEFGDRALGAAPSTNAIPSVDARLAPRDPILDAMAFSKGRFAVEVPGLDPLYLPSWPEVTRVVEDCRR